MPKSTIPSLVYTETQTRKHLALAGLILGVLITRSYFQAGVAFRPIVPIMNTSYRRYSGSRPRSSARRRVYSATAFPAGEILPAFSSPSRFRRQHLAHVGLGDPELSRYTERCDSRLEGCSHRIDPALWQRDIGLFWLPPFGRCF